jgi:hypothetical protein
MNTIIQALSLKVWMSSLLDDLYEIYKKMKDITESDVFAKTRQSDWRVCTGTLIVARYHLYFSIFNLIILIVKNMII